MDKPSTSCSSVNQWDPCSNSLHKLDGVVKSSAESKESHMCQCGIIPNNELLLLATTSLSSTQQTWPTLRHSKS